MTEHVRAVPSDVLVGDAEPAGTVQTQRDYFADLSSHQAVLARYAMRSQQDVADDRETKQRQAEARERSEEYAAAVNLGLAHARSNTEIFAGYAAECEIQDAQDRRRARQEADQRAAEHEEWLQRQQVEAELERQGQRSTRTLRQANEAAAGYFHRLNDPQPAYRGGYRYRSGGYVTDGSY
jgi:hypothetical protein